MTFREGGSKKIPVSVYSDEFKLLIENTPKLNFKIAFLLGYGSGMRISEIVNLTKGEVNLKEKSILIRQGKGGKIGMTPRIPTCLSLWELGFLLLRKER